MAYAHTHEEFDTVSPTIQIHTKLAKLKARINSIFVYAISANIEHQSDTFEISDLRASTDTDKSKS